MQFITKLTLNCEYENQQKPDINAWFYTKTREFMPA